MANQDIGHLCYSINTGQLCYRASDGALVYKIESPLGDIVVEFSSYPKTYIHREGESSKEEPLNAYSTNPGGNWQNDVHILPGDSWNLALGNVAYTLPFQYIPNTGDERFYFFTFGNYSTAGDVEITVKASQSGVESITKSIILTGGHSDFAHADITIGPNKRLSGLTLSR
jgi:hypothetical protein